MFHATTILGYKAEGKAVIGGDGQVTFGDAVLKGNATKIRTLHEGKVLAGFAEVRQMLLTFLICLRVFWQKKRVTFLSQ